MKHILPIVFAATAFSLQAKDIRLKDCPAAVQKTIKARLDGGKIDDIDRVLIKGKTRYIVDIDVTARREVTFRITPSGKIVQKSEDVDFNECPKAVRTAINNQLEARWKIDDIDRITSNKVLTFRVEIDRNNAPALQVTFSSSGKVIEKVVEKSAPA